MSRYSDVTVMPHFVAHDGTPAVIAARLINFPTGNSVLQSGHQLWLQEQVVPAILARPNAWVDLYGFASKKGNAQSNLALSKARATAVKDFLGRQLAAKGRSIEETVKIDHGWGEDHPLYKAGESDDSPNWRAAEVIVFGTKPRIVRKPKVDSPGMYEIRVVGGGSASVIAQADNYFFQIVDLVRMKTMFYLFTGMGLGISIPKIPGPGSVTKIGPPTKFTTTRQADLHQFNSEASLSQDPGATFGSQSVGGTMYLAINKIIDGKGLIFTNPKLIPISGGWGVQMPGLRSVTRGVLAAMSDEFPFTGY